MYSKIFIEANQNHMIFEMNNQGTVTLKAENKQENVILFEIANEHNFKSRVETHGDKPQATTKRAYKKRTTYHKQCPVEGCEHRAKSMALHLRNKHGILPDGTVKQTFTYNGATRAGGTKPEERPVSMPVVKTNDGYRLKKAEGLLGHADSFTRSRIIS